MSKKIGIKYLGPVLDGSGYAEFARNFICALNSRKDTNVTVEPVSYETCRVNHGKTANIVSSLTGRKIDYDIKVINSIPDSLSAHVEPNKKNISFTMFETTRIPDSWVTNLNKYAQACFVPCEWNKEVFENSGVKIPIFVVPAGVDIETYKDIDSIEPIELSNFSKNNVCFYSIFQWTERKNPEGLLAAYWSAFTGVKDVCLILKTYGANDSPGQQEHIKNIIKTLKYNTRLKDHPRVIFVGSMLSKKELLGLHRIGDCFVLPHRAEGFGMPHIEAMAMGKPVISTGFSGNMDFMNKENSYLLDYQMTPVTHMPWIPYYEADMLWAEPNLSQLITTMKQVYKSLKEDDEAKLKGALAREHVLKNFNWQVSASKFVKACREVINA